MSKLWKGLSDDDAYHYDGSNDYDYKGLSPRRYITKRKSARPDIWDGIEKALRPSSIERSIAGLEKKKQIKKLYYVTAKGGIEEYITETCSTMAWSKFLRMHPKAENIRPVRVPNVWWIRFSLIWKRIAIEMARENYSRWRQEWNFIWSEITAVHVRHYKMWLEDWVNMWADIGHAKWEHRSRFDYLEID